MLIECLILIVCSNSSKKSAFDWIGQTIGGSNMKRYVKPEFKVVSTLNVAIGDRLESSHHCPYSQ